MASPDGQGYLIPENPTPEEMACILVFYPDDPFYLRALLGALSYFGTWTAWERDASKRGRLAAAAWKEANECTYDSMGCLTELVAALGSINITLAAIQAAIENQEISLDPADLVTAINGVQLAIENQEIALDTGLLLPALTGIQTAIENQEMVCNCAAGGSDDMGIVNVYCGCGCGSGAGTGSDLDDGTAPGGTPIDDAMPPVDNTDDYDDGTDYDFTQQDACALVHWVLLFWRNTLLGVASGELAISSVWSLVDGMFQGLFTYSIPKPGVVDEILLWFGRLTSASTLAAEIDRTYESIQCRLLQRDIYRDKYADVCDIIDTWATSALTKLYAKRFIDILPFRWIYSSNVIGSTITNNLVPAWAYARGCPSCVQEVEVDPFPTVPTGYRWRVGTQAVYSVGGGVTATPLGNVVDASVPLAGADRFLQMRYANYNATGVFGIAVFVELMPAEMIVLSGGWFVANTTFMPSEFSKYVIWADKGAPVVDWGDWVNVPATKTLTLDLGRMNFLQGGGLYRFTCLELVPE